MLQAVKRGIKRALPNRQGIPRYLLDPLDNGISMNWPQRDDLENQHVEGALEEFSIVV